LFKKWSLSSTTSHSKHFEEIRCNLSLNNKCPCGEGERWGGREYASDRSQCQTGRLIRKKEGWCIGVGAGVSERG